MKDLYLGDFAPPDVDSSKSKGILEKEAAGGGDGSDMLSRVFLAVAVIGIIFFLYSQVG